MKKKRKRKIGKHLIYDIHKFICLPFLLLYFRPKRVYENDNAKKKIKGGHIQISNHNTYHDCVYFQMTGLNRRLYLMSAFEVIQKHSFLGKMLLLFLAVPIDRDNFTISDFKRFLEIIRDGHVLNIFAEGHINFDSSKIDEFKDGAALLAIQSNTPVRVLYMPNRRNIFERLRIGTSEPINLNELGFTKKNVHEATIYLREKEIEMKELVEKDLNRGKKKHE